MTDKALPYAVPASQRLRLFGTINPRTLFATVLGILLAGLVLPPLLTLLEGSFVSKNPNGVTHASLDAYRRILTQSGFLQSVANSFAFALGSAAVAVVFGGVVAWLTERTNVAFKPLARLTTMTSLATPNILYVGAWLMLLGRAGPINAWWRALTGARAVLINVYSLPTMIFVEGLVWQPMVFLLVGATLRNFNPELEEAARMSGADIWQIFRRITLRLSLPALAALAMLVFIRSLEAFEVPALLGIPGHVHLLTTDIFETLQMMPPDLGSASALAAILLVIVAVLLYAYGRLTRDAGQFATITGKNFRPSQFDLGRFRWVGAAVILINFTITFALPLLALVWASLLPFYQVPSIHALSLTTLTNYAHVLGSVRYLGLMGNTVVIAIVSATAVMLLASLTAWMRVRKAPGAWLLDTLATLPLVFPGIILGVAVMQLFLTVPVGIYGTIWIIAWAFVINALPYGIRYSFAGMLQLHKELEEAAIMSGASGLTSLRRIVLPLLSPSLLAGWVFIFLLCTRVLSLPVLLSGPGSQTMAVAMFDLLSNGQAPELAALGLLWSLGMTVIVVIVRRITQARGAGIDAHG